jgi:Bacterial SH3 domain
MEEAIKAIQVTPVPTMLIVAGLFFLLLGFVSKLGGMIEVSPEQKKFTIPIGLLVLTIGLVLYFSPSSNSSGTTSTSESTPTSTLSPPASGTSPRSDEVEAVIDDPDGYTNIRSGQGTQYSIIARVNKGEVFYAIPQQSDDWWPVRTKDNKYGYIHRSIIRVKN